MSDQLFMIIAVELTQLALGWRLVYNILDIVQYQTLIVGMAKGPVVMIVGDQMLAKLTWQYTCLTARTRQ